MIHSSLTTGIVGILGSAGAMFLLSKRHARPAAHHSWMLGLGGLLPAWIMSFIILLQSTPRTSETPLPPSALFSSSIGLLGIIATEFLTRRLEGRNVARSHWLLWLLGVLALSPGWAIALWAAR